MEWLNTKNQFNWIQISLVRMHFIIRTLFFLHYINVDHHQVRKKNCSLKIWWFTRSKFLKLCLNISCVMHFVSCTWTKLFVYLIPFGKRIGYFFNPQLQPYNNVKVVEHFEHRKLKFPWDKRNSSKISKGRTQKQIQVKKKSKSSLLVAAVTRKMFRFEECGFFFFLVRSLW